MKRSYEQTSWQLDTLQQKDPELTLLSWGDSEKDWPRSRWRWGNNSRASSRSKRRHRDRWCISHAMPKTTAPGPTNDEKWRLSSTSRSQPRRSRNKSKPRKLGSIQAIRQTTSLTRMEIWLAPWRLTSTTRRTLPKNWDFLVSTVRSLPRRERKTQSTDDVHVFTLLIAITFFDEVTSKG